MAGWLLGGGEGMKFLHGVQRESEGHPWHRQLPRNPRSWRACKDGGDNCVEGTIWKQDSVKHNLRS